MGLIAKNIVALLGSQVATWAVGVPLLIIVPQYLGDRQFGQLSFAYSFAGFFGLFASLGMGSFIVKQTARDSARVGSYVFNALVMCLLLTCLLSVAAIGTSSLMGYDTQTRIVIAVACAYMVWSTENGILVAGLQGQQRMRRTAIWAVVDRYAESGAIVAALVARKGLLGVAIATSLSGLISIVGNGAQLFRQVRAEARLDLRLWKVLAFGGMPFLLGSIVLTIYGSIDVVILSKLAGDVVVGWYSLAYRLVGMPIFLATIVVTAYFPQLSAQGASASPSFAAPVSRAVRQIWFVTAPMAAGLALVAADLIAFLHYPAGFGHSVPLIQILALHIPVVGVTMVLGSALMACDRQKEWVVVGVIAAVFNPLLNLFAIPVTTTVFGNGAVGASVTTVATELLVLSGALYLLRSHGIFDKHTRSYLSCCAVACAAMVGVVVLAGGMWLPVRVVIGVGTYGLASWALGTLSIDELRRRSLQMLARVRPRGVPSFP